MRGLSWYRTAKKWMQECDLRSMSVLFHLSKPEAAPAPAIWSRGFCLCRCTHCQPQPDSVFQRSLQDCQAGPPSAGTPHHATLPAPSRSRQSDVYSHIYMQPDLSMALSVQASSLSTRTLSVTSPVTWLSILCDEFQSCIPAQPLP